MKTNRLISQFCYSPLARVGFTSIITLLSWGLLTPQADAMRVNAGEQEIPPPSGDTGRGGGIAFPEGSGVFGSEGSILNFTDFSVDSNDNLPDNVISNGDSSLLDLVNTAAEVWEAALPEFEDIQLNIAWADLGNDSAAFFTPTIFEADENGESINIPHGDTFPSSGTMVFNSRENLVFDVDQDGIEETIKFFLDDNPLDSEVFGSVTDFATREGEGSLAGINIGRNAVANLSQFALEEENVLVADLFSLTLHELQHALGLIGVNPNAQTPMIITEDGREIPTTFAPENDNFSVHLALDSENTDLPTPVGAEDVAFGQRKCPSDVDVLAVAAINGFENPVLNPCQALVSASVPVPESSGIICLIMVGFSGLLANSPRLRQ